MDPTHLMTIGGVLTTVTPAGVDTFNDVTTSTSTAAVKCWVEQTHRTEQTSAGPVSTEEWRAYFPAGTTVDALDQLTVGGVVYELDGPPWPAFNPRLAAFSHIEASLRRVG